MGDIFFDLDGTLLNTQAGIGESIQAALTTLGYPSVSPSELTSCFGPPIRDSFARLLNTDHQALIETAVRHFRQHYQHKGIYNYQRYAGIEALLQQLTQRQKTLRVLTIKPQPQAEWLIQHAQLAPLFKSIHGSHLDGSRSDKTQHLKSLLQQQQTPDQPHWMIGDRASDVHAAQACGIHSVAVTWGYGDSAELHHANSDFVIHRPDQLIPLLIN
ncbi:HAD hydrolase-like protein [Amphritea sp. 1_MG-2023]|uniref:HAD hydrolase-like protein n=1 Tax=Amphritea sp. 1_MG-2023 TaxID=3062670 RepID=UPI0026E114F8|nr:HAD hydrolase-like protein [Amphritea sp. 1_MG-2023]MDO6564263.1 HAD hydrolase-like protein [Amphritea sp. 1_MG-2023]